MAKILIIEDEEVLLTMLAEKFEGLGHEVISSTDGEEGLAKVKSESPDLVLLDIILPKLSGMEILEKMHEDRDLNKVAVIIISNSGQPVEIEKAKSLGIRDYLIKTEFDPKEVVEKANKVLGGRALNDSNDMEKDTPTAKEESADSSYSNPLNGGSTVLVVEDDQFLRDLIVKKLTEEGLDTTQAIDGEEGLRLAKEAKPMIVLLDLILPGIDGFEVLKKLKADASLKDVPVVILSNLGQKDDIDKGLKLGATDYLIKAHFTPSEIVDKVRVILGQR
jgi:DNA-binding response OmpR family regulator